MNTLQSLDGLTILAARNGHLLFACLFNAMRRFYTYSHRCIYHHMYTYMSTSCTASDVAELDATTKCAIGLS